MPLFYGLFLPVFPKKNRENKILTILRNPFIIPLK
jgi:hypothetical protein